MSKHDVTEDQEHLLDSGEDDDNAVAAQGDENSGDDAKKGTNGEDAGGKKDGEKPAGDPSIKELRRELNELRKSQEEMARTAEYWRGKAEGKGAGSAKSGSAAASDDEDDDAVKLDEDLVDAISSNDAKRISKALKSMGFVRAKDVERTIQATRGAMTREAALLREYPDLGDEKSELYEATARHYRDLIADDPALSKSPSTLRMAAKLAKAELGGQASGEEDRAARVARQSGGGSGTRSRAAGAAGGNGSGGLNEAQRRIISSLRAAGANITEDGYKKRASEIGVNVAGLRPR